MQNFWEKLKGQISTLEKYHAYLNHYCEPVPHHISILFVLYNAEGI